VLYPHGLPPKQTETGLGGQQQPAPLSLFSFRRGLLPLLVFRPWRHDTNGARVGNRLSQVLGSMARHEKQDAAFGILAAEPV
jgi:hypothetical protein